MKKYSETYIRRGKAEKILGVCRQTLLAMIKKGEIKAIKTGIRKDPIGNLVGEWRFNLQELLDRREEIDRKLKEV